MAVVVTHSTPADGTFSATGAAAWNADHTLSGLGTMAEQNANNVNITGGSLSGVTGVATSGTNSNITSLTGLTTPLSVAQGGSGTATPSLVAGTNITISGSWPNQTINATASGSVTSVTASSPLASSGGATPDISLTGIVAGTYGGTGVNNGSKTITLGGNFTTSGAFNTTLTATANTSLTLPVSGYVITSVTNMSANPVTGTPSNTTFLRGDGTWATVSGSMVYPGAGIPNSTGSAWGTSYTTTGSGTVVALATSPVFTTPDIGVATATSITFPDAIQITAAANRGQIEQMRLGAFT